MRVEAAHDTWLVGGVRSAFGRFGGALAGVSLVDLGARVARAALDRNSLPLEILDEMHVGVGMIEAGLMVPARQIAVAAGLKETLPSLTVDRRSEDHTS